MGAAFKLADAASYFPCAGWLWAEGEAEESQHILHPPTQNLAEALIPPTQPDVSLRGEDGEESSHGGEYPGFFKMWDPTVHCCFVYLIKRGQSYRPLRVAHMIWHCRLAHPYFPSLWKADGHGK